MVHTSAQPSIVVFRSYVRVDSVDVTRGLVRVVCGSHHRPQSVEWVLVNKETTKEKHLPLFTNHFEKPSRKTWLVLASGMMWDVCCHVTWAVC